MSKKINYVYGSAAPNLQPEINTSQYSENNYQVEANEKLTLSKKIERNKERVQNSNYKAALLVATLLAFLMCFSIIYRYARITELNYMQADYEAQYNDIRNDNSRLLIEIQEGLELEKIEAYATSVLGMHKPDQYQKIEIAVPKTSYAVTMKELEAPADNAIQGIVKTVTQLISSIR